MIHWTGLTHISHLIRNQTVLVMQHLIHSQNRTNSDKSFDQESKCTGHSACYWFMLQNQLIQYNNSIRKGISLHWSFCMLLIHWTELTHVIIQSLIRSHWSYCMRTDSYKPFDQESGGRWSCYMLMIYWTEPTPINHSFINQTALVIQHVTDSLNRTDSYNYSIGNQTELVILHAID